MSNLIEKIRNARRFSVKVGDISFSGMLPTREQFYLYGREGVTDAEIARKCVDGWDNVTEADLLDGGSSEPVPFDKALFDEVIGDKQEWWRPISDLIIDRFKMRSEEKAEAEKNSRAGSKAKA